MTSRYQAGQRKRARHSGSKRGRKPGKSKIFEDSPDEEDDELSALDIYENREMYGH